MHFILRLTYCFVLLITVFTGHSFGQLHHELQIEDEDAKIRYFGATAGGTWLVGATYDDLYVWNVKTGKLAKQIKYSADRMAVNAAAGHVLLRNNKRRDSTVLDQLDITTQELKPTKINIDLKPLQFSADGKRLLCEDAEEDGFQVYEYPAMKPLLTTRLKQESTQDIVKLSPKGALLAFVDDSIAEVWSVETGERVAKSGKHIASIRSVAFSPEADKIAIAGKVLGREGLAVFHAKTLLPVQRDVFECHRAFDMAWLSDRDLIAINDDGNRTILLNPTTYDLKSSFLGDRMKMIRALPGGDLLATTHYSGGPSVWDWQATKRFRQPKLTHATHPPMSEKERSTYERSLHLTWNRKGSQLAIAYGTSIAFEAKVRRGGIGNITSATRDNIIDGTEKRLPRQTVTQYKQEYRVSLLDPRTGKKTHTLPIEQLPALREYHVDKICFSPNGSQLACLLKGADAFVLWSPVNNRLQVISDETTQTWPNVSDFDFSPSGKTVALASGSYLYIYDVAKNQFTSRLDGKLNETIRFIGDEEFLSGFDVYSRDPVDLKIKGGPGSELLECDQSHAFSLRYDYKVIQRYDLESLEHPTPFRLENPTQSIALSKDGTLLAAGSSDGLIRVWSAVSGRLLTNLKGHVGSVESIDFAPQGLILASAGRDGKTMIWDLRDLKDSSVAPQKPSLPTHKEFRTANGASVSVSFDRPATNTEVRAALQEVLAEVSENN